MFLAVLLLGMGTGCATGGAELARDYYNLGVGYLDQGDYFQAQQYFVRALDLDPGLTRASYNLARAQLLLGQPEQAVHTLQELLQNDTENILVRETLAYAHGAAGDWAEAAFIMGTIAEQQQISLRGWNNYAVTLLELQRYQSAYDAASRALRIDPENARAKTMLVIAAAYIPEGLAEHEAELNAVVQRTPDSRLVTLALGDGLEYAERYDLALDLYRTAARVHTEGGEVAFRHARLLVTVAEDQQAGVTALTLAVSQGFDDVERLQPLLQTIDIDIPDAIRDVMNQSPSGD